MKNIFRRLRYYSCQTSNVKLIVNLIAEQTDLKINDVVGLELFVETMEGGRSTRDISHPPLYGTVDIYLVHSHDLFLRDTIDAKGHQGVKGDTSM